MKRPRLLIEDWLPAAAIGVECIRERSTGQQPPDKRLHVWWARRPLAASRAAVLGSLLPADFPRDVFERLMGFWGSSADVVRGQRLLDWAKANKVKVPNPHGERAFKHHFLPKDLAAAHDASVRMWGGQPKVIDPMAGGGSIPLESARLGFDTVANEYNPVACVVLEATVDYPFRYGKKLGEKARKWGAELGKRFNARAERFYPKTGFLRVGGKLGIGSSPLLVVANAPEDSTKRGWADNPLDFRNPWSIILPTYPPAACCRLKGSHLRVWPLALLGGHEVRTIVYVDGFNLYYAIRSSGCKWLNLKALSQAVLPSHHSILGVKYYTARVSGSIDPDQPRRQQIYLNALRTIPEVEIHFGTFLAKEVWRPVVNLPVADRDIECGGRRVTLPAGDHQVFPDPTIPGNRAEVLSVGKYSTGVTPPRARPAPPSPIAVRAQVHWMEEKGSDVSLASHLIHDGWVGRFEAAAVLSNDTDLVEPIRIVTQELKKPIILLCAASRGAAQPLQSVATSVRHIRRAHLLASRFPDQLPGTSITKPDSW